jgi:hypothetical protein
LLFEEDVCRSAAPRRRGWRGTQQPGRRRATPRCLPGGIGDAPEKLDKLGT